MQETTKYKGKTAYESLSRHLASSKRLIFIMRFIDLTGKRFGKLVVIKRVEAPKSVKKKTNTFWLCKCDCGKETVVVAYSLGKTKSCGCLHLEKIKKHGKSKNDLYAVWQRMLQRCYNKNDKGYKNYGGRGIVVCDEWRKSFLSFESWSYKNGYKQDKLPSGNNKLSIDRINNDGNYCPENCRWVDYKTQSNNTSRNHLITIKGETKTMQQWCDLYSIDKKAFYVRVKSGKQGEDLIKPIQKRRKRNESCN